MILAGVYQGLSQTNLDGYERWLGDEAGMVLTHLGIRSWDEFNGSAAWLARDVWAGVGKPMNWSVPLTVFGSSLEQAASGAYNAHYRNAAEWIAKYSDEQAIYIRPGWEFNGYWMPWSAKGHEQAYVGAFRQLVETFESVSSRFVFEWTVNSGDYGMNPATVYPGDRYVDIVGMDFYQDPVWRTTPQSAWKNMVERPYSLQWLEDFAQAHGKPTAYSEWGIAADNMGPYVMLAKHWFDTHNVVYQNYWDADAGGYFGKLSDGSYWSAGQHYRDVFRDVPQITTAAATGAPEKLVDGTVGTDTWFGTAGNDQITSHGGGDLLFGAKGGDIYILSSASDRVVEFSTGGVDTVKTALSAYTLPKFVENLTFTGTAAANGVGNDLPNILTGNDGYNWLRGGDGNDKLFGRNGSDDLHGGLGNDELVGDDGNDRLRGDGGRDFLNGGNGNDSLDGGTGNDELWGLAGDDIIHGGDGTDRLFGNAGRDSLYGGNGNDLLTGSSGNDRLDGGAGTDTAVFAGNASAYRVQTVSSAGHKLVTELATGEQDYVSGIEVLKFADASMLIVS